MRARPSLACAGSTRSVSCARRANTHGGIGRESRDRGAVVSSYALNKSRRAVPSRFYQQRANSNCNARFANVKIFIRACNMAGAAHCWQGLRDRQDPCLRVITDIKRIPSTDLELSAKELLNAGVRWLHLIAEFEDAERRGQRTSLPPSRKQKRTQRARLAVVRPHRESHCGQRPRRYLFSVFDCRGAAQAGEARPPPLPPSVPSGACRHTHTCRRA
jgi:hypothetical protein